MKAPFPWFGGKSRVADVVWRAFGNVPNYVEPFAGSLAVLLSRPHEAKIETVNDLDCYLANFWRATKQDPEGVARHCDWPVNEADLHARQVALMARLEVFRASMHSDPDYFDPKVAGWWAWGVCSSISGNWISSKAGPNTRPHLSGVNAGMGVHKGSLPALGHSGKGINSPERGGLLEWFDALASRLRRTRVACGDWSRVVSGAVTGQSNSLGNMGMHPCGVFLDPPYALSERAAGCYREDAEGVSADVRRWALENGDDRTVRIALCGYTGEHEMPPSWAEYAWKAQGGMGNRRGGARNANANRERIWFSPHCLPLEDIQTNLFGGAK